MEKPKRVALYARVSTRDKGQETENQLRQLREFCAKQDWHIVNEYVDQKSAKAGSKRPKFDAMFAAASRREFDLVLFWALDRFSREGVLETLQHLTTLTSYGVGWKSFTEQYLDSCGIFKDAVLAILSVIAKQEQVRLSERVLAGLETARKKGRFGGRPRTICDRRKIAAMRASGAGYGKIAKAMKLPKSTVVGILART